MVAALLRLRFRVLANTLVASPLQLTAVVLGAVQALAILVLCGAGLFALSAFPVEVASTTIILGGTAVVLGWMLVPLVTNGIEQTLDPLRLAAFPIPLRRLMLAQFLVGVAWIPGAVTLLLGAATVLSWGLRPGSALVSALCGIVGAVTAIVGSRMMSALTGILLVGRRRVVRGGILVLLAVAILGPVTAGVAAGAAVPEEGVTLAARIIGWTPFGAVWAVPGHVADGDVASAAAALAIAVATLAVMIVSWRGALVALSRQRGRSSETRVGAGRLGALGRLPATVVGAVAARSLIYWASDPRYTRQLVVIPLVPVLLGVWATVVPVPGAVLAGAPAIALVLPLTLISVLSYDGTAFALHLAAGVRGRDDRRGRAAALAGFATPIVVLAAVASVAAGNAIWGIPWSTLPAVVGLSIGLLFTGLGVVAVSSAMITLPVPRAGTNPFAGSAGAGFSSIAASYAVTGATLAASAPEIVLGVIALVSGSIPLGIAALVVGSTLGLVVAGVGIRIGGGILDRRAPELLARLRRQRV